MTDMSSGMYFTFKGVSSNDMGVYLTKQPTITEAISNGEKLTLPGRSGYVYTADGSWSPVTVKIECAVPLLENRRRARGWLTGFGALCFSDEAAYCYDAGIITASGNAAQFTRLPERRMTVTFTCQPFRRHTDESGDELVLTRDLISGGSWAFKGQGDVNAQPLIAIEGDSDDAFVPLFVNLRRIDVRIRTDVPLYIDCEAGKAFTVDESGRLVGAGSDIELDDDWWELSPCLSEGEYNIVTPPDEINKVTISPRWRFY